MPGAFSNELRRPAGLGSPREIAGARRPPFATNGPRAYNGP
jgi:hypothetical protein